MAATATLTITAAVADATNSVITSDFTTVSTDVETMKVYVRVNDQYINQRGSGYTDTVNVSFDGTDYNGLSQNGSSLYEATVNIPDVDGSYNITASVNGDTNVPPLAITVVVGNADLDNSTIQPIASQTADATDVLVKVKILDGDNNNVDDESVTITLNGDTQPAPYVPGTGFYEYTFSNPTVATTYVVSATVGGQALSNTVNYVVTHGIPDDDVSDITITPGTIAAGNNSSVEIDLQDQHGNNVPDNGGVTGVVFNDVPDNLNFTNTTLVGDGTITATVTGTIATSYSVGFTLVF